MMANASSQKPAGYDLMIIVVCGLFSAYTLVVICRLLMEGVPDKLNHFKTPTGTATPCMELDMRSRQSREGFFPCAKFGVSHCIQFSSLADN
jgi:hypothetical protein